MIQRETSKNRFPYRRSKSINWLHHMHFWMVWSLCTKVMTMKHRTYHRPQGGLTQKPLGKSEHFFQLLRPIRSWSKFCLKLGSSPLISQVCIDFASVFEKWPAGSDWLVSYNQSVWLQASACMMYGCYSRTVM